jgi:hypothetical protein
MSSTPSFALSVAKTAVKAIPEEADKMIIIVRRRYAHLEKELSQAFSGKRGVRILVDRRRGERRKGKRHVSLERRKADRRKPKEELIKVVLSP